MPGWQVAPFQDISLAVATINRLKYDLYIIDLLMTTHYQQPPPYQYAGGEDFVIALKKKPERVGGPIVILTSAATGSDVWKRNGEDYLVSKDALMESRNFSRIVRGCS
jgi:hypothetical protein